MRCQNRAPGVGVQCTLDHGHPGINHAWFCGSGGFTWPRLHMLGAGAIIWRQVCGYNLIVPPLRRGETSAFHPLQTKASIEYYRRIDKI